MMYKKAMLFQDRETAGKILQTDDVAEIKAFGQRACEILMIKFGQSPEKRLFTKVVLEKFRQNPELSARLEETGEDVIAECVVKDRIWGIGLSMKDEDRFLHGQMEGTEPVGEDIDASQGRN